MSAKTTIEWCDSTINGSSGCDGCELWNKTKQTCYAGHVHENRLAHSFPDKYAADFREVRMIPGRYAQAARWSDLRGKDRPDKPWLNGMPRLIFVGDMGDFLSRGVTDEFLVDELFSAIKSPAGQRHFWLLLTKRPRRLDELSRRMGGLPENCMAMTTVTDQETANRRIPQLMAVRCKWRGLSIEPLLGHVDLDQIEATPFITISALNRQALGGIPVDWVIGGGESGTDAEATHPHDARRVRDQCVRFGVPFLWKQWGEWLPQSQSEDVCAEQSARGRFRTRLWGDNSYSFRVGRDRAGRLLDGREWNEMPLLYASAPA
ncbi:MAG TPA: DUF5131 family protein [Chthoniobacterales bacterium]|nr:DUF5131 family protein [Chthoniobacterales bacterium]